MKTILLFFLFILLFSSAPAFSEGALTPDKHTLFLARYDGETLDADYAAGSSRATLQGKPEIIKTPSGGGVRIADRAVITYEAGKNMDFRRGTVEMTIIPEWSSGNAPGVAYLFALDYPHPYDVDYESYFNCRITGGKKIEFRMYDHLLAAEVLNWKRGETHRITFAWDSEMGLGLKVDDRDYYLTGTWKPFNLAFAPIVVGGAGIGGAEYGAINRGEVEPIFYQLFGGIVDEFRISAVPLIPVGRALAKESFIRGKPPGAGHASPLRLIEFYDPEIIDSPLKVDYYQRRAEGFGKSMAEYREDLRILRERNHLDEVVHQGKSEYEKQVLLCQWLTRQFPHGGKDLKGVPAYEKLDAAREGRAGGLCGAFSSILGDCFRSMGWSARYVSVSGHASFECWSNEFNKWVNMEPDYSAYPSKEGVPLNLMELHDLYVASIEAPEIVDTFDSVPGPFIQGHPSMAELPDKGLHYYSTLRFRAKGKGLYLYWDDYARLEKLPGDADEFHQKVKFYNYHRRNTPLMEEGRIVEEPNQFYWTLNRVKPILAYTDDPDSLKVTLSRSLTPLFQDYVVRIDDGSSQTRTEEFSWPLHPGLNTLEVRVRNEYGVCGHPGRISIWVPPDK